MWQKIRLQLKSNLESYWIWTLQFLYSIIHLPQYIYIYIYIIIGETERNSNYNFKLEFQFCTIVLNYLFLKNLFLNFRIKCGTIS